MSWWRGACWIVLVLLCGQAWAGVRIADQAWLEDSSGRLGLAQVQARPEAFTPYQGILSRGYTSSTHWVRLTLAPDGRGPAGADSGWILRIRPSFLDDVALFDSQDATASAEGGGPPHHTGDRHRLQDSSYRALDLGFDIPASREARVVWLRIRTTSAHIIHVEAMTRDEAVVADQRWNTLCSLYLASLLMFCLWSGLQALSGKDRLFGFFCIHQLVVLGHALSFLGFGRVMLGDWLPPERIDALTTLAIVLLVGTSYAFHLFLLREFHPHPLLWRLSLALAGAWGVGLVLLLAGSSGAALHLNMLFSFVGLPVILGLCLSARAWKDPQGQPPLLHRKVLLGFYFGFVLLSYSGVLPFLGLIQGVVITINMPTFTGFLSGLLMLSLLTLRERNREQRYLETTVRLGQAQQRAREERERREEQERFLSMLTHELKTPLSVARMSLARLKEPGPAGERIGRALGNIDAVVERCRLGDQLDRARLQPRLQRHGAASLLRSCIEGSVAPARIQWTCPFDDDLAIDTDAQLLGIVIGNLLDNALKYCARGAQVGVGLARVHRQSRSGIEIRVTNPPGPAGRPDPGQVFTRYYRAPGAQHQSGSGLGLFLAQGIARLLGAELALSHETHNVEFILWHPA